MIQIDDRAGSQDIAPILRKLGVEVELCRMPFGDIAWTGVAQNQCPVSVGVELKSWPDVLACIQSGRFAGHQLPGLIKSYDHVWLLVFGELQIRSDGALMELRHGRYWAPIGGGRRLWLWREVEGWLLSMQLMGGMRVQRELDLERAALWTKTAYNWYQRSEHKSHQVVYSSKEIYADTAMLIRPSLARRVAKELPQVGLKRSKECAERFKTVYDMAMASEQDWAGLLVDGGKRLGSRGKQVYRAIRGYGEKS